MGDDEGVTIGLKCREQVERRLKLLEEKDPIKRKALEEQFAKYRRNEKDKELYDENQDVKLDKKRKIEEVSSIDQEEANKKIAKKLRKEEKKKKKKKKEKE